MQPIFKYETESFEPVTSQTLLYPSFSPNRVGKGKVSSSESDQSSTETDSTVKSQEERTMPAGQLDPQELAQKILEETQSHMQAVENLQKANAHGKTTRAHEDREEVQARQPSLSTPTTPTLTGAARGFQPSKTSAFSRPPSRASLKTRSSPLSLSSQLSAVPPSASTPPSVRPKPPSRSSSLQKITPGHSSPARSPPSSSLSVRQPTAPPDGNAQIKLKYPSSPYTAHISPSHSPADCAPSPALSYSSAGSASASSSPANTPESGQSKQSDKVQAIHNLKTFWANSVQKHDPPSPASLLRSGNKKMSTVQKDVLGLLNLSPRHESTGEDRSEGSGRPRGHQTLEARATQSPTSNAAPNSKGSFRFPSENGYKSHSPGHFFPSSKC